MFIPNLYEPVALEGNMVKGLNKNINEKYQRCKQNIYQSVAWEGNMTRDLNQIEIKHV